MAGGFQTSVSDQPAIGVEGDFYDTNPRFSVTAGPGGLVAGPSGAVVGRFAWAVNPPDGDGTAAIVNSFGAGPVTGFLAREQQGLITTFLADASLVVPSGFQLGLMSAANVLVKNRGSTQALPGQTCYATFADGGASFASASATSTAWGIAAETWTSTASVSGSIMTVTAGSNIYPGVVITSGATGTVVSQLTGTPQGAGTYELSVPEQSVASTTISGTYGLLTLTTVTVGTFGVGDLLTGATAGVVAGTTITAGPLTGSGGSSSTFIVNATQTSGNGTEGDLTAALNVATKWVARSAGLPGELVKISSFLQG